jgi:hypothetical protein
MVAVRVYNRAPCRNDSNCYQYNRDLCRNGSRMCPGGRAPLT